MGYKLQDHASEGYPTIATVGAAFIFFYALYYSTAKVGRQNWRNHPPWFFINFLLWMFGIFLIFGPDSLYNAGFDNTSYGGVGFIGPRAAIIGLQLCVQASLGVAAIYFGNAHASLWYGVFAIFNILCLIGSNYLFNYNEPIWLLNQTECNLYFRTGDLQRCRDDGYLEVLRVFGNLAIILEAYLIVVSILAYVTAVPVAHNYQQPVGQPVGAPLAGGAAYAPAGTYNTTTTGVPANTTYTTGVPANTQYTTGQTTYTTSQPVA